MGDPWNFARETSSRFHCELDLEKLRTFHQTAFDSSGEFIKSLPEGEQSEIRASFEENARAVDAVMARGGELPTNAVPCDVIMFNSGEAPDRAMTKLGGLPFWPARRRWPTNWRGKPLSFLGQINFRDSRDVIGDIPAEILVMFVNEWDWVQSFWIDPTEEPLISAEAVPDYGRKFGTSYGVIHRTYDVPGRSISDEADTRDDVESMLFDLKIGGAPWGHPHFSDQSSSFLFQLEAPGEVDEFEDGSIKISGSFRVCKKFIRPWSRKTDEKWTEWEEHWWTACLKRNGKLRWSWA